MNKNIVTILFLSLITIVLWVAFQVFDISSQSTIPPPTQEQIRELDPNLDQSVFDDLKKSLK